MDVEIDRSEHPGGPGALGQPEPSYRDIDGAALARSLGARFRRPTEMWPGARSGDGIIEFPIR
jgi:hypothetical protein